MEMVYHSSMTSMNSRRGTGFGVSRAIASSIPNRKVRMMMRTLTSHASHCRSSNMGCIWILNSPGRAACLRPAWRSSLASQLCDHREQRHVERNNDAADHHAQQADDDWFQHGQHVFRRGVDFVFIKVGNLLEHSV